MILKGHTKEESDAIIQALFRMKIGMKEGRSLQILAQDLNRIWGRKG